MPWRQPKVKQQRDQRETESPGTEIISNSQGFSIFCLKKAQSCKRRKGNEHGRSWIDAVSPMRSPVEVIRLLGTAQGQRGTSCENSQVMCRRYREEQADTGIKKTSVAVKNYKNKWEMHIRPDCRWQWKQDWAVWFLSSCFSTYTYVQHYR